MPLPSQSTRSSGVPASYRRRKGPGGRLIVVGVLIAAAVVVWLMLPSGERDKMVTPGQASAKPSTPAPAIEAKREPAPEIKPKPRQEKPVAPLVEINQGRSGTSSPAPSTKPAASTPAPAAAPPVTPVIAPKVVPSEPKGSESAIDQVPSVAAARRKQAEGDLPAARVLLSKVLADGKLSASEEDAVRDELTKINEDMVFGPKVTSGDPYAIVYKVEGGDSLVKIAQKNKLGPDWRLIQRVNRMSSPNRISLGQSLKLIKGPFHAVVHKARYRLDLYMGPPDDEGNWLYIRSFSVGLGEGNSTPTGMFMVRKGSKLVDPYWVNPRTGERFESSDPKNPIGEYWIGLEGIGDAVTVSGYGIHGTIDPDSIGKQKSMGCVRLSDADIALLFELLGEQVSMIKIEQ